MFGRFFPVNPSCLTHKQPVTLFQLIVLLNKDSVPNWSHREYSKSLKVGPPKDNLVPQFLQAYKEKESKSLANLE